MIKKYFLVCLMMLALLFGAGAAEATPSTQILWACVDYASGNSILGAAFYGFSWLFAPNTSIIFGYGTYNNGAKPTVTTQLDINL